MSPHTLTDFLTALHPPDSEGFIDLRALPSKQQEFRRSSNIEAVERFIRAHPEQNIYLGIASRMSPGDGSLVNCGKLHALFADIDFKSDVHPNGIPEPEARAKLEQFLLKPSIVVNSGGGLQVYWLLWEPIDLQVPGEAERAKSLLRRLTLALGGDLNAAEAARILRVPGTLNHRYTPPRQVLIEAFNA
jgi:hypothetical protein